MAGICITQARAQELIFSGMREQNTAVFGYGNPEKCDPFSLAAARHVLLRLSHGQTYGKLECRNPFL